MANFDYNIVITGDCSNTNSGVINLYLIGGTPPYTVEWISPYYPAVVVDVDEPAVITNLSATTYVVRVNDSTLDTNNEFYINIPVSNGVCGSILGVGNTTCDAFNGSVTGTSTSLYSSTNYYLYDNNDIFIQSAITNTSEIIFGNLSADTYYMIVEDLGGCTGKTQNFIIQESGPFEYGLYVVPNSSCGGIPIGKIVVTGQTGVSPYTYLWSNGLTGSTVTGLTAGNYSVEVTDSNGCVVSQSGTIVDISPIGLGLFTSTAPTCFQSNGSISMTITGGTAPYYYSASTGQVEVSYSKTFTISGLPSGQYGFSVTDAGFCQLLEVTSLTSVNGISSVSVSSINSTCSSVNGEISISVVGGATPYTYTLVSPGGNTTNVSNSQTTQLFSNLSTGTYMVAVSDSTGCAYTEEKTIIANNKYTISTGVTGTTCNQNNGVIEIFTTTGATLPLDYSIDGIQNIIDTNLSAVTFNNLTTGTHVVTVNDADGCVQTTNVYVPASQPLDFSLYSSSCGTGNEGTISAFIASGTPPFTYNWSSNVPNNPQTLQVSGLTGGTYTVRVVDKNGCSLSRSTTITCDANYVSYQTYVMGAESFNVSSPTKYGLLQMMNEGFNDLTSGDTGCQLVSAIFNVKVSILPAGITSSQAFFTSTSLNTAPSDNLYYNTVKSLLLGIPGVGVVDIDSLNNQITIQTSKNNTSLNGQEVVVDLIIVYDTTCLA
jgi:hypothetical protein